VAAFVASGLCDACAALMQVSESCECREHIEPWCDSRILARFADICDLFKRGPQVWRRPARRIGPVGTHITK